MGEAGGGGAWAPGPYTSLHAQARSRDLRL